MTANAHVPNLCPLNTALGCQFSAFLLSCPSSPERAPGTTVDAIDAAAKPHKMTLPSLEQLARYCPDLKGNDGETTNRRSARSIGNKKKGPEQHFSKWVGMLPNATQHNNYILVKKGTMLGRLTRTTEEHMSKQPERRSTAKVKNFKHLKSDSETAAKKSTAEWESQAESKAKRKGRKQGKRKTK